MDLIERFIHYSMIKGFKIFDPDNIVICKPDTLRRVMKIEKVLNSDSGLIHTTKFKTHSDEIVEIIQEDKSRMNVSKLHRPLGNETKAMTLEGVDILKISFDKYEYFFRSEYFFLYVV